MQTREEGRLAPFPSPITQTSLISTLYLPMCLPSPSAPRRVACSLHVSPCETLASPAWWQAPPTPSQAPEAASRACLPLHAVPCPHVMSHPRKGWLVLWDGWEGAGDTWAISPIPRWRWVARQGWESDQWGTECDPLSPTGFGGLFKALGTLSQQLDPTGSG